MTSHHPSKVRRVSVIDTHTGGEPTRVVVAGGPDLGDGPIAERLASFRIGHDTFRSAVVNEPRGSDVMVGALVVEPHEPSCALGVIFFNNTGYLGMCGHGTIGVAAALHYSGRLGIGTHRFDTPVGVVGVTIEGPHYAAIDNVESFRWLKDVTVDVPGLGPVTGDVAWGGNWFFLVKEHQEELTLANVERLTDVTWRIRQALEAAGVTGSGRGLIDHIELFGPPTASGASARNFVLCPGKAYDRSPCGTGTSAKVACLAADGKLREGETWVQESIVGSTFEATFQVRNGRIRPRIRGSAHVNAESTLIIDQRDPFAWGIRA
jgi:4-hydroxyproline epimerase